MRWLAASLVAVIAFVALSLMGGSAIWTVLRGADGLTLDGRASTVREVSGKLGDGWPAYGGDSGGHRYSAAEQITPENVAGLKVAWTYRTGAFKGREAAMRRSAFEATPILVENKLVFCTQFNDVIALDPVTGQEVWRYDPRVPLDGRPANQFTCRGVSYWASDDPAETGLCSTRLFMGTVDSRLVALDTATGQPCLDFGEGGEVRIEADMDLRWPGEFQITSAPAIAADLVITGTAIGDNLRTEAPMGTVFAFDARSGALRWTFDPIPQAGPDRLPVTGHANVWSTISVDEDRGLVFLPTSSPSPDYFGGNRLGDDVYANSVVALDAATGNVAWHFQTVHHDVWDFDLPAQPGLYEVWANGEVRDVVAQVTKTGLLFVLDRDTGEPFLPVEERAVPQAGVEGEVLSPTQPFPAVTPPIVPNRLDPAGAFGITFWDKRACETRLRNLRQDGLFTPPSLEGTLTYPFQGGGANWGSTAYDPARNLLVVNMNNVAGFVRLTRKTGDDERADVIADGSEYAPMEGAPYVMQRNVLLSPIGLPCSPPPWGVIAGIDLANGEIVWRKPFGTTRDLAPGGVTLQLGTPNLGGPIVTASGLVFIGAAMDNYLRAFDVESGDELWKGRLPAGGQATPMTYEADGRQFVVIAAGGHSTAGTDLGDHVVAFALD